jgi:hypothetical protein
MFSRQLSLPFPETVFESQLELFPFFVSYGDLTPPPISDPIEAPSVALADEWQMDLAMGSAA